MRESSEYTAPIKKVSYSKGKHEKYDYYENASYDYDTNSYVNIEDIDTKADLSLLSKILLILMVMCFNFVGAVAGIIVACVFMAKDGEGYIKYGKKLIIISIVFLVLDIAIIWIGVKAVSYYIMLQ